MDDAGRQVAQFQARAAQRFFALDDRAGIVKRRERPGQVVQVRGQNVRPIILDGPVQGLGKPQEGFAEGEFLRRRQGNRRGIGPVRLGLVVALAEDAPHARVRVLHVRSGVAVEREHLFPREDVVAGAVLGEVGVLDGPDADLARDVFFLVVRQRLGAAEGHVLGVLLRHEVQGAFLGLVQQGHEFDSAALAGLKRFAVGPHHGAEGDVLQGHAGRGEPRQPRGREELLKVERLPRIDHVEDFVGPPPRGLLRPRAATVPYGRKVGRGVQVPLIGFLDKEGQGGAVLGDELGLAGVIGQEDALRAFGLGDEALGLEVLDDARQVVVVGRLASDVGILQQHAKPGVDFIAVVHRYAGSIFPGRDFLLVGPSALLQHSGNAARYFRERRCCSGVSARPMRYCETRSFGQGLYAVDEQVPLLKFAKRQRTDTCPRAHPLIEVLAPIWVFIQVLLMHLRNVAERLLSDFGGIRECQSLKAGKRSLDVILIPSFF
jgi:hypothetical protein